MQCRVGPAAAARLRLTGSESEFLAVAGYPVKFITKKFGISPKRNRIARLPDIWSNTADAGVFDPDPTLALDVQTGSDPNPTLFLKIESGPRSDLISNIGYRICHPMNTTVPFQVHFDPRCGGAFHGQIAGFTT